MPVKTKDTDNLKVLSETGQNLLKDLDQMMNELTLEEDTPYSLDNPLDQQEEIRLTEAFEDYIHNVLEKE